MSLLHFDTANPSKIWLDTPLHIKTCQRVTTEIHVFSTRFGSLFAYISGSVPSQESSISESEPLLDILGAHPESADLEEKGSWLSDEQARSNKNMRITWGNGHVQPRTWTFNIVSIVSILKLVKQNPYKFVSFFPIEILWWPSPVSCWVDHSHVERSSCTIFSTYINLPGEFFQVAIFRGVGFLALVSALIFLAAISYQHVMLQPTAMCQISGDWSSWSSCHLSKLIWLFPKIGIPQNGSKMEGL